MEASPRRAWVLLDTAVFPNFTKEMLDIAKPQGQTFRPQIGEVKPKPLEMLRLRFRKISDDVNINAPDRLFGPVVASPEN